MGAIRARYNLYLQAKHRLEQVSTCMYSVCVSTVTYMCTSIKFRFPFFLSKLLIQLKQLGHSVDKVETFLALDDDYKDYFVRNLHDALSGHTSSSVQEAVK